MLSDQTGFINYSRIMGRDIPSTMTLWSEHFINCLKWVIPGLMFFDGCRNHNRFVLGIFSLLGLYFLIGIQVIKWMPLSTAISGEVLAERSLKILDNEIGYHRVDLAMMLAGASWAIFSLKSLASRRSHAMLIIAASLTVFFSLALTGGRTGYATWALVGCVLCFIRWRKYLLLAPLVIIAIIWVVPGTMERMTQGFNLGSRSPYFDERKPDLYTVTAGRNLVWPYVIEKIDEAPFLGYGRQAMIRTGISAILFQDFGEGEAVGHPHNAYMELLLDNGLVGFVPVLFLFILLLWYSTLLFRDSRNQSFVTIGGITLALILAQMIASVGSQSFYPREGAVGMWCAIGLMLRVFVERSRVLGTSEDMPPRITDELLWTRVT